MLWCSLTSAGAAQDAVTRAYTGLAHSFVLSGQGNPITTGVSYTSDVSPLKLFTSFGLFAHPPYQVWRGGMFSPVTLSFRLAAGGNKYSSHVSGPELLTGKDLHKYVEGFYRYALPLSGKTYTEMTDLVIASFLSGSGPSGEGGTWIGGTGYVTNVDVQFDSHIGPDGYPIVADCTIEFKFAVRETINAGVFKGTGQSVSEAFKGSWETTKGKASKTLSELMKEISVDRDSFSLASIPSGVPRINN